MTLVELMVVLVVLAVIAAIAAPSFGAILERRRVQAVAAEISSDFALFRQTAQLRANRVFIQFQQTAALSCYTAWNFASGGSCNCTKSSNVCDTKIEVKTMQIPSSTNVTFFPTTPFTPTPKSPYPVLSYDGAKALAIPLTFMVTVTGAKYGATLNVGVVDGVRVLTCTPNNTVPGVQPC